MVVFRKDKLKDITAAQPAALSYLYALKYVLHASHMVKDGYKKFPIFRVPELSRWVVLARGSSKYAEEMSSMSNDVLSVGMAVRDLLQTDYTLGSAISYNPYHAPLCARLTKNLDTIFPRLHDEIVSSFSDYLPSELSAEWTAIRPMDVFAKVVCRAGNRIFVGLPVCRNTDYMKVQIEFTTVVPKAAAIIAIFPEIIKPLVARFLTNIPASRSSCLHHIQPLIEQLETNFPKGHDPDSETFLGWLVEKAKGEERNPEALTCRILTLGFASQHTTVATFVYALYRLAAHPEYAEILRSEVESVTEEYGWTSQAIRNMRKVDSFLRESQRLDGLGTISGPRKAMRDFTFSDGTRVPEGAFLSIASQATHLDKQHYPNAETFDPWRFCDDEHSRLVDVSPIYLPFGFGRHVCPGRFFAACEMKTMLAHIVWKYDIALPDSYQGQRPKSLEFMSYLIPNPSAQLLFHLR